MTSFIRLCIAFVKYTLVGFGIAMAGHAILYSMKVTDTNWPAAQASYQGSSHTSQDDRAHSTRELSATPTQVSSYHIAWLLVGVMIVGIGLSMLLDTDTRWMGWHMSRLGESESAASSVFNLTLILAALLVVGVAARAIDELARRRPSNPWLLGAPLTLVALALIGLSACPSDYSLTIHNIFGYGQFFVLGLLMLGITKVSPLFSKRTVVFGYGAVAVTGTLMALFHMTRFTSLLFVEMIGLILAYTWILSLTYDLRP